MSEQSERNLESADPGRLIESGWQKAVAPPSLDARPTVPPVPSSTQAPASSGAQEKRSDG